MKAEESHLANLFQYDEIYWVPADRGSNDMQLASSPQTIDSNQVQDSSSSPKENEAGRAAANLPETIENSFESEPSLDGESSKSNVRISTPWVVIGHISELEKSRLTLIFSAPPMLLSAKDWSIYEPKDDEEPILSEFVKKAGANKFIFLGQQPAVWQSDFHVTELVPLEGKLVYFFPRLISTLTDTEKSLKLVFWNALKSMI
jgi:hypothetical protein